MSCPIGPNPLEIEKWRIDSNSSSIMGQADLETLEQDIGLMSTPDMVYDKNFLEFAYGDKFKLLFTVKEALKTVEKDKCPDIEVHAAANWKDIQKERPTKRVYDWTYKTRYLGSPEGNFKIEADPKAKINTEMLQRREPIQYYRDIRLFDDELDDNGMATLHVKTRVMPSCYLVLLRYFLRVDRVKVKLCDCRVFHKFGSNEVIREYTEKSAEWTYLTNTRRVPVNHTTTPEAVDQYLQLDYKYSDRIIFE